MRSDQLGGGEDEATDLAPDLCLFGCYWACEHRPTPGDDHAGILHPVHDEAGRALNRCRECGDFFYSVMEHSREHARKRQLGWLPEHLPEASHSAASIGRTDLGGS